MPAPIATAPAPSGAGVFSRPAPSRHLLGLEGMSRQEVLEILDEAQRFRDLLDGPGVSSRDLEGVTVCNAFFENSTRTRVSFELAERPAILRLPFVLLSLLPSMWSHSRLSPRSSPSTSRPSQTVRPFHLVTA